MRLHRSTVRDHRLLSQLTHSEEQAVLRHVHLDAAADHVAAAFLHDRLPPPPAALRRGSTASDRRGVEKPEKEADAGGAGRKPLSKADRKRQKQVRCWTGCTSAVNCSLVAARDGPHVL